MPKTPSVIKYLMYKKLFSILYPLFKKYIFFLIFFICVCTNIKSIKTNIKISKNKVQTNNLIELIVFDLKILDSEEDKSDVSSLLISCFSKSEFFPLNSIEEVKIVVKSYTPNPLKMNNPLQREVITFTLKNNFRGATLYYKNYNITTQSHIIPYLFKKNKTNFLAYDYYSTGENDNSNSEIDYSNTYYLEFFLSSKVSFLERNYEQIHTTLANFVGVFNSFQAIGGIFSFLFDSFSKEFFIFNFIIKYILFIKKRRKSSFIANPPPKIYSISNNYLSNNNNKEEEELNNNNNEFQKRDKTTLTKDNLFTEEYLNEKNKKSITDKESKDIILGNQEENNKKEYRKIEGIQINILKTFWLYILNSLEKEESKYPDIQNALNKLKLIQGFFDTSTYLNLIFDVMRLKKVIFNEEQIKLFETIHFTEEDIMQYFDKLQSSGDAFEDKSIYEIIQRNKRTKNSKLTDNIIKILNEQINF